MATVRSATSSWPVAFAADRRVLVAFAAIVTLTALGTLGYVVIESMTPGDALYMTVITLSTVGYHEVKPLSDAGRGFTMALIALGVGTVFYTAGALAGFVIEGRLRDVLGRRSMQRSIDSLHDHVILCGFGRLGRAVLQKLGTLPVVVIDPDASLQRECEEAGHLFLLGSALEEGSLRAAGIERARALIAATPSDPDNVFISLSARELCPQIPIHARAETPAGVHRLELAGANQVISPHQLAGQRIANALLRPGVVEFLELSDPGTGGEVDLEEVVLGDGCPVDGVPLRQLHERGLEVVVIAIKRGSEKIQLRPGADAVLLGGDRVVAIGDRANLRRLAEVARQE